MKGISALVLLLAAFVARGDIYVSPDAEASGTGTAEDPMPLLSALATVTGGDTVRLLSGRYAISETIVIDKSVTLAGDLQDRRAAVIDAGGLCRAVQLKDAGAVLAHLTVSNGVSSVFGGGVLLSQAACVSNCVVTHCTGATGGGVASEYSTKWSPVVTGCEIAHCRATNTSGGNDGGGGVLLANCMKLRDSVIRDCWCDRFGAICAWADRATCEVSGCVVTNNGANVCAGLGGVGCPLVTDTVFVGNRANSRTGVFYSGKDQPHMTNVFVACRFIDNLATNGNMGVFDVAAAGSLTLVSNCAFVANGASKYQAIASCTQSGAAMGFFGCGFTNNFARYEGGCFMGGGFTVEDCSFYGNRSEDQRGGVFSLTASGAPVSVRRCRFVGNETGNVANDAHGGAIYSLLAEGLVLEDSDFSDNSARQRGGAMAGVVGTCRRCVFEENVANGLFGSAVACNAAGSNAFESCVFRRNGSANCGAVFVANGASFAAFAQCGFLTNGVAGASGGALDLRGPFLVDRCVFDGNSGGSGGAVNVSASSGDNRIVNSLFTGNSGSIDCGALYCAGACLVENCTLAGNTVVAKVKNAGGIALGSAATMRNCISFGNCEQGSATCRDFLALASGSENNVQTSCVGAWKDSSGTVLEQIPAGNIASDPLFADAASGNFAIRRRSPCRDTGTTEPWMREPDARDLAGGCRVCGSAVDMGAYEYVPSTAGFMLMFR